MSLPKDWHFIQLDSCDSTNLELKRRLESGKAAVGDVILTKEQTQGRGRMERKWISPLGNLAFSFALPVPEGRQHLAFQLNLVMGLALVRAIQEQFDLLKFSLARPELKWPNDVLISGQKAAGILSELVNGNQTAIIGIGVNFNATKYDFPEILQPHVSTLRDVTSRILDETTFLEILFTHIRQCFLQYESDGLTSLLPEVMSHLAFREEWVKIQENGETFEAQVREVTSEGFLKIMTQAGETRDLIAGDVNFTYVTL